MGNGQWNIDPTRQADRETIVSVQKHGEGIMTKLYVQSDDVVRLVYSSTIRVSWRSGFLTRLGVFRQSPPFWTYWYSSIPQYMLECLRESWTE